MAFRIQNIVLISTTILISVSAHIIQKSLEASKLLPEPIIPTECLDQGYCEHVPNYPKQLAAKLIKKLEKESAEVPNLQALNLTKFNYFYDGQVPRPASKTVCKVEIQHIAPKAAKDINGKWHFVLNRERKPVQDFKAVKCKKDPIEPNGQESCEQYIEFLGASGRCAQQYATVSLTTFDRHGAMSRNYFNIPCCCSCEAYV